MALEQATAQQRMGQAVIRRLANARLVPDGGVAVDGVFAERPLMSPLGDVMAQGRDITFRAVASELPSDFDQGGVCSVFVGDQRQLLHGRYEVSAREDAVLIDTAVLQLQHAPA